MFSNHDAPSSEFQVLSLNLGPVVSPGVYGATAGNSLRSDVPTAGCILSPDDDDVGHGQGSPGGVGTSGHTGEKSPMCLVNELCRFNGVKHEYQLIGESGPPHNRTFNVVLRLAGVEEYRSSGSSIRKAQHTAAEMALRHTQLPHPTSERMGHKQSASASNNRRHTSSSMTPTVELNVMAMKLGKTVSYTVEEPKAIIPSFDSNFRLPGLYDYRGMHNQRYHFPRSLYTAVVTVGDLQFVGMGKTAQVSRHSAAEKAIKFLKTHPTHDNYYQYNHHPESSHPPVPSSNGTFLTGHANPASTDSKSPISLLHELSTKINMPLTFDVINESGPSHMPCFVTRCHVGDFMIEAEGNSKKVSKKRAAEKMLQHLKEHMPPIPNLTHNSLEPTVNTIADGTPITEGDHLPSASTEVIKKTSYRKERSRKSKKSGTEVKACCEASEQSKTPVKQSQGESGAAVLTPPKHDPFASVKQDVHPINQLIELQLAKKEPVPEFKLLYEKTIDKKRKEYAIECSVSSAKSSAKIVSATGVSLIKKQAKRMAAEALLRLLYPHITISNNSHDNTPSKPPKETSKDTTGDSESKVRKVKFCLDHENNRPKDEDDKKSPKNGRQLAPGLLFISADEISSPSESSTSKSTDFNDSSQNLDVSNVNDSKECNGSRKFPEKKISPELKAAVESLEDETVQIHMSEYPKSNGAGYLTVVTVTTTPPIVCYGTGKNLLISRDRASFETIKKINLRKEAPKILSETIPSDDSVESPDDQNVAISHSLDAIQTELEPGDDHKSDGQL